MTDWTAKVRAGLGKIPASGPDATVAAGLEAADAAARDWLLWRAGPVLRARIERANTSQLSPSKPSESPPSGRGVWDDWTLASAMESTRSLKSQLAPAFLWFELAAESNLVMGAASAENLADASRLVSWLMGQILFELTSRLGPEVVIYPGLRGQPWVDWFHRGTLQRSTFAVPGRPAQSVWQTLGLTEDRVLQQVSDAWLPPHFVALVPADFEMAPLLEVLATARDKSPWRRLTDACWSYLSNRGDMSPQQRRSWDFQISHGWRVTWQIWPWQSEADLRGNLPPVNESALHLPPIGADPILPESPLWRVNWQAAGDRLRARQHVHEFSAWPECLATAQDHPRGRPAGMIVRDRLAQGRGGVSPAESACEPVDALGAIGRVWVRAFLAAELHAEPDLVPKPAATLPDPLPMDEQSLRHQAVVVASADDRTLWSAQELILEPPASRENQPPSVPKASDFDLSFWRHRAQPESARWHLELSEALTQYGLYAVRRIVQAHGGTLIHAWGDDIVAVVSPDEALGFALGLSEAFRGAPELPDRYPTCFQPAPPGFLRLKNPEANEPDKPFPAVGATACLSVGIAAGASQLTLEALLINAQTALDRAKAPALAVDRPDSHEKSEEGWGGNAVVIESETSTGAACGWGVRFDCPLVAQFVDHLKSSRLAPDGPRRRHAQFCKNAARVLAKYPGEQRVTEHQVAIVAQELRSIEQGASTASPSAVSTDPLESPSRIYVDYLDYLLRFVPERDGVRRSPPRRLSELIELLRLELYLAGLKD